MAESLENEVLFLEGLAMVKYDSDVQACVSGWISLSGTWVVLIVKKNKRNYGVWCGFENEMNMRFFLGFCFDLILISCLAAPQRG